uniref:Uncharacterized protein n=1 Tax=Panagrolaimus davidi TaxID=227884 RepID=A0A914PAL4_9BILA
MPLASDFDKILAEIGLLCNPAKRVQKNTPTNVPIVKQQQTKSKISTSEFKANEINRKLHDSVQEVKVKEVECRLNVQIKNQYVEKESTNFMANLKPFVKVSKNVKKQQQSSSKKSVQSKSKAAENLTIKLKPIETVLKDMTKSQLKSVPLREIESIQPLKVEPNSSLANLLCNFKFESMEEYVVGNEEGKLHKKCDKNVLKEEGMRSKSKAPTPSKPKESKPIQPLKIEPNSTMTTSKTVECNLKVQFKNHILLKETTNFTVRLKSNEKLLEKIKIQQLPKKSKPEKPHISISLKPKKFANIEIQTDETSFNQRIVKTELKNDVSYDSDAFSISPKSSVTPIKEYITEQKSPITASSGFASTSDYSPYQIASPNIETTFDAKTIVTFLFRDDETCAVEICKNGRKEIVKNSFDNEWTPLYFSMAQKTPEIGEKAQIHCHQKSEHVLYGMVFFMFYFKT